MNNETKTPHPHAELIKAWADGARIQIYNKGLGKWFDCNDNQPEWRNVAQYRIKPEKTDKWKPVPGETYFYLNDSLGPSEEEWDGSNFDQYMFEYHNCFKTREEAEAAAKRVKAALKGEESEEVKKLRRENEELKKEIAKAEARKSVLHPHLNGKPVSNGELALIRAIRKAGVSYVWQHGCAILVDKEDFETHRDFIALLSSGVEADDDEVRAALNAISREQEQEAISDEEGLHHS